MISTRLAKIAMVASLAAFAFIVTYDNLIDYDTNFQFVQHVLSMDTTFPDNALLGRAIHNPTLRNAANIGIIATEGLTFLAFAAGTVAMIGNFRAPASRFHVAKRFIIIGAAIAFLLWFTGFMVVGGEYFAMWQSHTWNGKQSAFQFYITALAVLIFVMQPDLDNRT